MIGFLIMVLLQPLVFIPMPLLWQIVLFCVVMTVSLFIDAITVRLVEVRRWRGVLGYDA